MYNPIVNARKELISGAVDCAHEVRHNIFLVDNWYYVVYLFLFVVIFLLHLLAYSFWLLNHPFRALPDQIPGAVKCGA